MISLPTNDGYFNEGDDLDFIYQVTNGVQHIHGKKL